MLRLALECQTLGHYWFADPAQGSRAFLSLHEALTRAGVTLPRCCADTAAETPRWPVFSRVSFAAPVATAPAGGNPVTGAAAAKTSSDGNRTDGDCARPARKSFLIGPPTAAPATGCAPSHFTARTVPSALPVAPGNASTSARPAGRKSPVCSQGRRKHDATNAQRGVNRAATVAGTVSSVPAPMPAVRYAKSVHGLRSPALTAAEQGMSSVAPTGLPCATTATSEIPCPSVTAPAAATTDDCSAAACAPPALQRTA